MSPIVAIPVIAMLQLYPAAAQTSCIREGEPFMSCSKPLVNACKRSVTVTYFDRLQCLHGRHACTLTLAGGNQMDRLLGHRQPRPGPGGGVICE